MQAAYLNIPLQDYLFVNRHNASMFETVPSLEGSYYNIYLGFKTCIMIFIFI